MSKTYVIPGLTEPPAWKGASCDEAFRGDVWGTVNVSNRETSQPGRHLPDEAVFELNSKG